MKLNKVYVGIVLVFFAGIALGAVGSRCLHFAHFGPPHGPECGPPNPPSKEMILDRISHDLRLSGQQIKEVEPAVYEMHDKMESLREEHAPKVKEIIDGMMAKIQPVLQPDQQKDLEKLIQRFSHPPHDGPEDRGPDDRGPGGHHGHDHGGPDFDDHIRDSEPSPPR